MWCDFGLGCGAVRFGLRLAIGTIKHRSEVAAIVRCGRLWLVERTIKYPSEVAATVWCGFGVVQFLSRLNLSNMQ